MSTKRKIDQFGRFCCTDRTGVKYDGFTVIRRLDTKAENGSVLWEALCEHCGKTFAIASDRISNRRSCGCKSKQNSGQFKTLANIGCVVNDIELVNVLDSERTSGGYRVVTAKCLLCGKEKNVPSYSFARKSVKCDCDEWQTLFGHLNGRTPLPNQQSHVNLLYSHYKRSARDRNLVFALTIDQFRSLITAKCFYCGAEPIEKKSSNCAGLFARHGIDRVDNNTGYVFGNCVPCCKTCNFMKNDMTREEFILHAKKIATYCEGGISNGGD